MTAYELPTLSTGSVDLITEKHPTLMGANDYVWVKHPDLGVIQLDRTKLVATTPPEPPDGYYLDRDGDIWRPIDVDDPARWYGPGGALYNWAELNQRWGPLKRLIPDPADTVANTGYWSCRDATDNTLTAEPSNHPNLGPVYLRADGFLTVDDARALAAWLLHKAREARQP